MWVKNITFGVGTTGARAEAVEAYRKTGMEKAVNLGIPKSTALI